MKKIKLDTRLNLNKETISTLNDDQLKGVKGGGFMSIGACCTNMKSGGCNSNNVTRGIFCSADTPH
ncbi:hypothetical protein G3O08_09850 [Cryomorpha ignava]|uniref:Uncharacterized protein n=1 Tax=Cryomorpha ignava TaxID=101383 RepID=A0A7K3WQM9_9FLAO|nr:class I lanthipeptide [Cryomorpha ignava]NEN23804.1 hypothetical protein [Cryomorpha ignava]